MKRILKLLALLTALLTGIHSAGAESGDFLRLLTTGVSQTPLKVHFDSVRFHTLTPFDEERTESLDRLIRHLSVDITTDHHHSDTVLSVDGDPFLSITEQAGDDSTVSVYSLAPEMAFESRNDGIHTYDFLENRFFVLNRLLDDLYPLFDRIPLRFADKAKTEKVSLNYTGYGRGVKKITFQFSAEEVKSIFSGILDELTVSDDTAKLIRSLVFDGKQKIILIYDADDHLLRLNYDGKAGHSENDIRKLSVICRSVRNDGLIKDKITVKSPAVKGYNRDNVTYERTLDYKTPENTSIVFDYQLDNRSEENRKKIHWFAELDRKDTAVNGSITYDEKGTEGNQTITVQPELLLSNGEYSGTLEITRKSGKIVLCDVVSQISLSNVKELVQQEISHSAVIDSDSENGKAAFASLQQTIAAALVKRLVRLPAEDLDFLNHDLDAADWTSLIDSVI